MEEEMILYTQGLPDYIICTLHMVICTWSFEIILRRTCSSAYPREMQADTFKGLWHGSVIFTCYKYQPESCDKIQVNHSQRNKYLSFHIDRPSVISEVGRHNAKSACNGLFIEYVLYMIQNILNKKYKIIPVV